MVSAATAWGVRSRSFAPMYWGFWVDFELWVFAPGIFFFFTPGSAAGLGHRRPHLPLPLLSPGTVGVKVKVLKEKGGGSHLLQRQLSQGEYQASCPLLLCLPGERIGHTKNCEYILNGSSDNQPKVSVSGGVARFMKRGNMQHARWMIEKLKLSLHSSIATCHRSQWKWWQSITEQCDD